jgi:TRAP-type C4-dicarboxylate transport system substrate-binding protein
MKKIIALLLAAVMVFALCACSSSSSTTETTTDTTEAAAADASVPGTEAAAEAEAEAPAAEGTGYTGENVTITFQSAYAETETGGVLATYFKNYLEDLTDGAITVNVSYGGTLCSVDDELDYVGDGAINMMIFGHTKHTSELPVLCSIPDFAPDSVQNALDYFNYVLNDEAAGAAITAEAEAYGVKYLSVNAGGANYFLANFAFSNLTELIAGSNAFGNLAPAKFEALGFTVVGVAPWDYYTGFDTGLMDASQMDGPAMYSMSLYEVAKYWMPDNTFAAGNFMTVNLDWWNGLSTEAQNAIQEACDATSLYSVEYNQSEYEALNDNLVANGVTLAEMTDAEFDQWWSAIFDSQASDAIATAEENGNVEAVEAVLQAAADFTGYDIQY